MSEPERREQPPGRRAFDEAQDATRRTRLANERTYLAWWRTGLTSIAVSLGAGRIVPTLSHKTPWPYEIVGAGFAVLGVACILNAFQREREIDRALQEGRFASMDLRSTRILTAFGVVLGILTLGLIVVNP
jgi:inner membrane protein YidH